VAEKPSPTVVKGDIDLSHLLEIRNEVEGEDNYRPGGKGSRIPTFKLHNINDPDIGKIRMTEDGKYNAKITNFLQAEIRGEEVTFGLDKQGITYSLLKAVAEQCAKQDGVTIHYPRQYAASAHAHIVATTHEGVAHIHFIGGKRLSVLK